jgi:ribosomal protein L37AE/L43A
MVLRWNIDKNHRCPECHAVAVDMGRPRSSRVYTCCRCGVRFTRWPRLAWLMRDVGVQCSVHRDPPST